MNKISENKVRELIKELKELSSLKDSKRKTNYWYNQKQNIVNSETISTELIKEFLDEYNRVKKTQQKTESVETDDRAVTELVRDEDGKIQFYTFEIYRKDNPVFRGKLDRKEMELIFDLYSTYGQNLTSKIVSRNFPQYTFVEFKRILRAYNLYKSCVAPIHLLEELTEEELYQRTLRIKENNLARRLEKDELKEANKLINKLTEKLKNYENKREFLKNIVDSDLVSKITKNSVQNNILDSNNLIIYLSDLHIGSLNEKYGYVELEDYNEDEIKRRLQKVFDFCAVHNNYNAITIVNLGDSVDSYNKETTRGGHELPTNLSNKEQSQLYIKIMIWFFKTLKQYNNNINYYCIGESNHDGDWGWLNNVALSYQLNNLGISTYISDQPIDKFDINDVSIVYLHGKDVKNQFKQFPLVLNEKTENWFNSYFIDSKLQFKNKICVVKGDLHQPAFTNCSTFDYISAPSVYGSSQYIVANFGKTKWGILYMEIDNLNNIKQGLIRD